MIITFNDKKHGHSFNAAHEAICTLANSQGFYSRILRDMREQSWMPLHELTAKYYFDTPLDFIMFIEGQ